ncbi:CheR family methyltransferase [Marinilabiliaceae bacterium ANBcel2]|nr:CheR family methyltransferase [Marinilabiliaceae bacterium ANBcel2]
MQEREGSKTYKEYLKVLKECSPYNFCEYSNNSIDRRITKIMRDNRLNMDELIYKTRKDQSFVEYVVESITVNTTELFRDPLIWEYLLKEVVPKLKGHPQINIWHAGCSTGQEVYSFMILLDQLNMLEKSKIYATDISQKALNCAAKGEYVYNFNYEKYLTNFEEVFKNHTTNVNFNDYFKVDKAKDLISVKAKLKEKTNFIKHDLVKEEMPFYNKFDIIFCRNVLIYFNESLQSRIVQRFHDNLFNKGVMVLGTHEGLNGFFRTKFARNNYVYSKTDTFHFKY